MTITSECTYIFIGELQRRALDRARYQIEHVLESLDEARRWLDESLDRQSVDRDGQV